MKFRITFEWPSDAMTDEIIEVAKGCGLCYGTVYAIVRRMYEHYGRTGVEQMVEDHRREQCSIAASLNAAIAGPQ